MKICKNCGKEFEPNKHNQTFCNVSCQRNYAALKRYHDDAKRGKIPRNNRYGQGLDLVFRYKAKCAICGWQATEELIEINGKTQYSHGNEMHHIVAVKDGGDNSYNNLILLCPNHHKQADMGLLTQDELKKYIIPEPTKEEKEKERLKASHSCVEAIAKAIYG